MILTTLFVLLSSLSGSTTGKLVFIKNFGDKVMEGEQVDFICRDSERDLSKPSSERVTIDWTFTNQTGSFPITRNCSLLKSMESFVFVPDMSLTLLKARVSDSGLYRCEIKKNGQKPSLTAEARLNVYHLRTNLSEKNKTSESDYRNTTLCPTKHSSKDSVIFDRKGTTPELVIIKEDTQLTLTCRYCVQTRMLTKITWLKENKPIINNKNTLVSGDKLEIAAAKYGQDDGLYTCVVTGSKGNISAMHLMTVIIERPFDIPEILTSVWARNITPSFVTVRWTIRNQGPYVVTLVSLKLRQLTSSKWQYKVNNIHEEIRYYRFHHLKPATPFVLKITAVNSRGEQDYQTLLFLTAPVNSTDFITTEQVLFFSTNTNALGVAFGVVGFFVALIGIYVCFSWANNRNGYKSPQRSSVLQNTVQGFPTREMETLNTTAGSTYSYYNRAFTDDTENASRI